MKVSGSARVPRRVLGQIDGEDQQLEPRLLGQAREPIFQDPFATAAGEEVYHHERAARFSRGCPDGIAPGVQSPTGPRRRARLALRLMRREPLVVVVRAQGSRSLVGRCTAKGGLLTDNLQLDAGEGLVYRARRQSARLP